MPTNVKAKPVYTCSTIHEVAPATKWMDMPDYVHGGEWDGFAMIKGDWYHVKQVGEPTQPDCFRLVKDPATVSEPTVYFVQMDKHGFAISCTCKGFQNRSTCKHCVMLPKLVDQAAEYSF